MHQPSPQAPTTTPPQGRRIGRRRRSSQTISGSSKRMTLMVMVTAAATASATAVASFARISMLVGGSSAGWLHARQSLAISGSSTTSSSRRISTTAAAAFLCPSHSKSRSRSSTRAESQTSRRPSVTYRQPLHQHHLFLSSSPSSLSSSSSSADDAGSSNTNTNTNTNTNSKEPTRPPTLPSQTFRPKQSLGQNFLSDQNYVLKICGALVDKSPNGKQVVELGPGPGALTRILHRRYPEMLAVEIDPRAVDLLTSAMPSLRVILSDVLQVDWTALAELRGGPLSVIGNLPYHITSQILFCLLDSHKAIRQAVVTMQLEVAQRIIAPPRCKDYGILSVLFQLYTKPRINFKLPNTVFYPQPKVTSALITLDFIQTEDGSPLFDVDPADLKQVLNLSFQQRRKMLRQSLKQLLAKKGVVLSEEWATKRPEELEPQRFVDLTRLLFGSASEKKQQQQQQRKEKNGGEGAAGEEDEEEEEQGGQTRVWRRSRHGGFGDEEEVDDKEEKE